MPISIPMMPRRGSAAALGGGEEDAGFVPPHMLHRQESEAEGAPAGLAADPSLGGLSPSTAAKREKLLVRNAILRSTGFLEAQHSAPALGERAGRGCVSWACLLFVTPARLPALPCSAACFACAGRGGRGPAPSLRVPPCACRDRDRSVAPAPQPSLCASTCRRRGAGSRQGPDAGRAGHHVIGPHPRRRRPPRLPLGAPLLAHPAAGDVQVRRPARLRLYLASAATAARKRRALAGGSRRLPASGSSPHPATHAPPLPDNAMEKTRATRNRNLGPRALCPKCTAASPSSPPARRSFPSVARAGAATAARPLPCC